MNDEQDRLAYALATLRRAAEHGYPWSIYPAEALALVAEVERLRLTVAALRASVPPTHPSDYGHEVWSTALRDAVTAERAAVVAWLRAQQVGTRYIAGQLLAAIADAIEDGEHHREEGE